MNGAGNITQSMHSMASSQLHTTIDWAHSSDLVPLLHALQVHGPNCLCCHAL